jgi:hypothetical protein
MANGITIVIQGFPKNKVADMDFTNLCIDKAQNADSIKDKEEIIVGESLAK